VKILGLRAGLESNEVPSSGDLERFMSKYHMLPVNLHHCEDDGLVGEYFPTVILSDFQ
jgi:hypothetical protein